MSPVSITLQIFVTLVAVWVQFSWFGPLRPFDVVPNVMLIVVVLAALWSSATTALLMAVFGGILLDVVSGADFGLRTGFFTLVALAIIAARQFGLHAESVPTALGILVLATVSFNVAILGSIGTASIEWGVVWWRIGAEILLNGIILIALYGLRELTRNRRARVADELKRGSWL